MRKANWDEYEMMEHLAKKTGREDILRKNFIIDTLYIQFLTA